MGSPEFGDYRSVPTSELEDLWARSVRPEEKRAMQQELTRRYLYTESSGEQKRSSAAGPAAPPRSTPAAKYAPGPRPGPSQPPPPRDDYRTRSSQKPVPQQRPIQQSRDRERRKTSKLAIASLILSIFWLYWLGSIAGFIFGCFALKRLKARNQRGRWSAIAGIVISSISLLGLVALIIVDSRG